MSRTYTISPDPFLIVLKDDEGNAYSCDHMDTIKLDGYSVHVPGIYDWYLYFNTYAEWNQHRMDKRFRAKSFHRQGKELAKSSERRCIRRIYYTISDRTTTTAAS